MQLLTGGYLYYVFKHKIRNVPNIYGKVIKSQSIYLQTHIRQCIQ